MHELRSKMASVACMDSFFHLQNPNRMSRATTWRLQPQKHEVDVKNLSNDLVKPSMSRQIILKMPGPDSLCKLLRKGLQIKRHNFLWTDSRKIGYNVWLTVQGYLDNKNCKTELTCDCKYTLQGTNISPQNGILKMIFLFPRWDMLNPWRVYDNLE